MFFHAVALEGLGPQERGKSLGVTAIAVPVALTVGPVIGRVLTSHFGWQSIFFINIPVGIIGTLLANREMPDSKGYERQLFDILGAVTIFLALTFLLIPLSYTETYGWENPFIIIALVGGISSLTLFIYIEKHARHPMMDLTLFMTAFFPWGIYHLS